MFEMGCVMLPGLSLNSLEGSSAGGESVSRQLFCFQVAVLNNHEQLVQLLLDKGADVSVKNEVMFTGILREERHV